MARYLLVAIDDNDKAESLLKKFDSWPGFEIVGLFGKPTSFCDCENYEGTSRRGKKFGYYTHAGCGRPRPGTHPLINLLYDPRISIMHQSVMLTMREPCMTPLERVGQKILNHDIEVFERGRKRMARWRRKTRRR